MKPVSGGFLIDLRRRKSYLTLNDTVVIPTPNPKKILKD